MSLDFEYGINTGNRFLSFVGHDEDPDEFVAGQVQSEEKTKKSTKDSKSVTSTSAKKPTSKTTTATTTTTASTANVSNQATKTNKENLTGKSTNNDQRRQQSNVLGDNNNQQTRIDSGRGGGRGFPRRGGSAGQDRPAYEGGHRGGGPTRTPRYNKFEGQQPRNETGGFEQGAGGWGNETGNDNQTHSGYRGRGGGRGNYMNRNYEGGRGGGRGDGRGRGRGGRGNYGNRSFEDGSQQQQQQPHEQQQQTQEGSGWQKDTESNFDNTRSQPARTSGQEFDNDASLQERPFEPDHTRRGGRGPFRGRTFHSNRHYGGDHQNQYEGDQSNNEYRHNRRQHDRQQRTNVSGVKPIEKKEGEGAHNWGNPAEIPDENPIADETTETTGQASAAPKAWADQVDEAEKQMTLDEYKKQLEEKKRAQQEKIPQFNRRTAGEGEDSTKWLNFKHEYRKKNDGESDEEIEEGSGAEEGESEEEGEEEQISGKKKVITIPLRFAPIDIPRGGPFGSRGGSRRGGGGGGRGQFRDRPYREDRPYRDDQPRAKSPSQQQSPVSQQAGEYQNDEQQQQSRPYRGASRQGSGRGEYRRSYGNSARGSRGGYDRSQANPSTPNFNNAVDFPTLPKQ